MTTVSPSSRDRMGEPVQMLLVSLISSSCFKFVIRNDNSNERRIVISPKWHQMWYDAAAGSEMGHGAELPRHWAEHHQAGTNHLISFNWQVWTWKLQHCQAGAGNIWTWIKFHSRADAQCKLAMAAPDETYLPSSSHTSQSIFRHCSYLREWREKKANAVVN